MLLLGAEPGAGLGQAAHPLATLVELRAAPGGGVRQQVFVGQRAAGAAQLGDLADDAEGGVAGRRIDSVQPLRAGVDLVARLAHQVVLGVAHGVGLAFVQRALELGQHRLAIRLVGVQLQAQRTEAARLQPVVHDVQRRSLLGHEQHRLFVARGDGDDVGDGLRLAGSRRSLHHQVAPAAGGGDHLGLAGVRVQHVAKPARVGEAAIEVFLRILATQAAGGGLEAVPQQLADQFLAGGIGGGQLAVRHVAHVAPHHELGERVEP